MKFIPPNDAEIDLWMLYSRDTTGTYVEGVFTHKVQAEAAMRWHKENDRNNSTHWIVERTTQPHGESQ